MSRHFIYAALALLLAAGSLAAKAADVELYPTGPAQDAAFIRFVDGHAKGMRITPAQSDKVLEISKTQRASAYIAVAGNATITGKLELGDHNRDVSVTLAPGEFASVVAWATPSGVQVETVHEQVDDFTAMRASIAFYNLAPDCMDAGLQLAGRTVFVFEHVAVNSVVRRQLNPVPLGIQLVCDGQARGPALDLGTLEAGERYSVFLVPGAQQVTLFHIKDSVAN